MNAVFLRAVESDNKVAVLKTLVEAPELEATVGAAGLVAHYVKRLA